MELFQLVKELAGEHRYSGMENESRACKLIAERLKLIGCAVELVCQQAGSSLAMKH